MIIRRLAALGVGYVLGARAGRGRYETISAAAGAVADRLDAYARSGERRGPRTTQDGRGRDAPGTS